MLDPLLDVEGLSVLDRSREWVIYFQQVCSCRILEGFDPQVPGFGVKTDQKPLKSDKKLDSVGQNISIQNLGFS